MVFNPFIIKATSKELLNEIHLSLRPYLKINYSNNPFINYMFESKYIYHSRNHHLNNIFMINHELKTKLLVVVVKESIFFTLTW